MCFCGVYVSVYLFLWCECECALVIECRVCVFLQEPIDEVNPEEERQKLE